MVAEPSHSKLLGHANESVALARWGRTRSVAGRVARWRPASALV